MRGSGVAPTRAAVAVARAASFARGRLGSGGDDPGADLGRRSSKAIDAGTQRAAPRARPGSLPGPDPDHWSRHTGAAILLGHLVQALQGGRARCPGSGRTTKPVHPGDRERNRGCLLSTASSRPHLRSPLWSRAFRKRATYRSKAAIPGSLPVPLHLLLYHPCRKRPSLSQIRMADEGRPTARNALQQVEDDEEVRAADHLPLERIGSAPARAVAHTIPVARRTVGNGNER